MCYIIKHYKGLQPGCTLWSFNLGMGWGGGRRPKFRIKSQSFWGKFHIFKILFWSLAPMRQNVFCLSKSLEKRMYKRVHEDESCVRVCKRGKLRLKWWKKRKFIISKAMSVWRTMSATETFIFTTPSSDSPKHPGCTEQQFQAHIQGIVLGHGN